MSKWQSLHGFLLLFLIKSNDSFIKVYIHFSMNNYNNCLFFVFFFCFCQGVTISTMKGILEEMMSLFPDKYFHLGLDEVITTTLCTMESKLNAYF